MDEARNDQNDLIIGRNAVFEAIKSGREIDRLFVQRGEQNPAVKRLISMAREKGAVIKEVDSKSSILCAAEECTRVWLFRRRRMNTLPLRIF